MTKEVREAIEYNYPSTYISQGGVRLDSIGHESKRAAAEFGFSLAETELAEKDKRIEFLQGQVSDIDKWNQDAKQRIKALEEFLKAHEQWEADFIADNSMWWPTAEKDAARGKVYESFLELQTKRNKLLNKKPY